MARNPNAANEAVPPGVDQEDADIWSELERLRADTGSTGGQAFTAILFRRRDDGSRYDRIRRVPLAQLDIDALPNLYGGGDYAINVLDAAGKYFKRYTVTFDTDIFPRRPATPPTAAAPAATAPASPAGSPTIAELMLLMEKQRQEDQARSNRLMETLLTGLLAALKPPDPVAQLAALKALMGPTQKDQTPVEILRDAVKQGIELGRGGAAGGGEEGEEGGGQMARIVEKGLDAFSKIVDARRAARPATAGNPPLAAGAPAAAEAGPRPVPPHLTGYLWLRKYVTQAIDFAKTGFPADRLAASLYELVPDEHMPALEAFVREPRERRNEILSQLDGRLAAYLDYLNEVALHLVEAFDSEGEPEGDDEGEDGDEDGDDEGEGDGDKAATARPAVAT